KRGSSDGESEGKQESSDGVGMEVDSEDAAIAPPKNAASNAPASAAPSSSSVAFPVVSHDEIPELNCFTLSALLHELLEIGSNCVEQCQEPLAIAKWRYCDDSVSEDFG